MIKTKRHAQNAVAAKARLKLERFNAEQVESTHTVFNPRKPAADFIITIKVKGGKRTQMSLVKIGKQFLTKDGMKSAREVGRGVELLVRYFEP